MSKQSKTVDKMIKLGWVDFECWGIVTFIFKDGVIKAVTKSGTVRDLTKSEKEQVKFGA